MGCLAEGAKIDLVHLIPLGGWRDLNRPTHCRVARVNFPLVYQVHRCCLLFPDSGANHRRLRSFALEELRFLRVAHHLEIVRVLAYPT